ncbi:MAG: hypothetical protein JKY43_02135 [Phycisphaerales bacterium]|nr:hypothetical protein [Phycisphaerales bacterium]
MFALLVAYVQGRGGVLDDRGVVIDTEIHGERDAEEGIEEADKTDGPRKSFLRTSWDVLFFGGKLILRLVVTLWFLSIAWDVGGWVGHNYLGVSGVFGNIAGVVACLTALIVLTLLGNRLTNARRDVRAQKGKQNLEDLHGIFYSVDQECLCGACGFSIEEFEPEEDGCVRCPECGAAWNHAYWENFLRVERAGLLKDLKKRCRKRSCLFDGRGQMMQVLTLQSEESRVEEIRKRPTRLALWDGFLLLLILLILIAGIAVSIGLAMSFHQTLGGNIALAVAVLFLVLIAFMAVIVTQDGIWKRRLQRFVRDRIDDRMCPSCEEPLENEPHPVDGALVCGGCGLAWDPATGSRRHHSKKRVPDEKYKQDPVFSKFTE